LVRSSLLFQQQLPQGWRVSVFGIACDPNGNVWLATMGNGLIRIAADGAVKSYTMKSEAIDNRHLNSLTNDYISHMSLSPDGKRIYLATTMGTCCLDIEHESWVTTFGQNCLMYGTSVFIYFFLGVAGSFLLLWACRYLENTRAGSVLLALGRHSLTIFCLQMAFIVPAKALWQHLFPDAQTAIAGGLFQMLVALAGGWLLSILLHRSRRLSRLLQFTS
jgi:hypothetical protein